MQSKETACILCSQNCGILVEQNELGEFGKIIGDPEHPISEGYLCQKATRLNYYQDQVRLTSPLRKKEDGSFEEISWDVAIQEIAAQLVHIRDEHGGKTIAYAGGGGQGNHMGGVFGSVLRAACDTPYLYSSLAQEKTGNFWVNGKLFGRQNTHYSEPVGEAEYVMILGANPVQSHGIPKARPTIKEVSRNPEKTLIVVDVRKTDTAKIADKFLQVRPGKDAFLLGAILGYIAQNDLQNQTFIKEHTEGWEEVQKHLQSISIDEFALESGVGLEQIKEVAEGIAKAKSFALRSDLGIEQSHNSTLNAYLTRLLFLITGHFGREGTNCIHTSLFPLIGHSKEPEDGGVVTQVTKMKGIAKLFPPNILPLEIDTDHPDRLRALIVDSANPVATYANTNAQRKAIEKLELSVVIDVAMTETAQVAKYVLPAQTQFEKMEATFFNLEFPKNFFHLRHPISQPLENTLPEPEIYHRLVTAMGELPKSFPLLSTIAKVDRTIPSLKLFPLALKAALSLNPKWKKYQLLVIKETLGKALPFDYAKSAAFIWIASHMYVKKYPKQVQRIGLKKNGYALGEALFNRILHSKSGTLISEHSFDESWELIKHKDKKVHLEIPEMLQWLDDLKPEEKDVQDAYPYNLIAGERRSYNANAVIRNPEWRKKDMEGVLKVNPINAEAHELQNGDWVKLTSKAGEILIQTYTTDEVPEGLLSMPHGYGFTYPDHDVKTTGAMVNVLTSTEDCDPLAKTPYHKNVRVKMTKVTEPI